MFFIVTRTDSRMKQYPSLVSRCSVLYSSMLMVQTVLPMTDLLIFQDPCDAQNNWICSLMSRKGLQTQIHHAPYHGNYLNIIFTIDCKRQHNQKNEKYKFHYWRIKWNIVALVFSGDLCNFHEWIIKNQHDFGGFNSLWCFMTFGFVQVKQN